MVAPPGCAGTGLSTGLEVSDQPSGLGRLPGGRMVLVSVRAAAVIRREHDGAVLGHADVSGHVGGPDR